MKKIKAAVVGYGNRGQVYADYSLDRPNEIEIVAVIDINRERLDEAKERYNLGESELFTDIDSFLAKKIPADIVINATMDNEHYETGLKILNAGYDMLLEKPITAVPDELIDLEKTAEKLGRRVFVCHVLRYTPFYHTIKQIIADGKIGRIFSLEMNEHVCIAHYLNSYDRGKWNNEEKCGSPMLLAKCCHDMDLMCWLNNAASPKEVASFGQRAFFCEKNAPERSTEYCFDCPIERQCAFSAIRNHLDWDPMPFLVWAGLNKPLDEITREEKIEYLKHSEYGKCAFKTNGNVVDRQNVIVNFSDGSIGTLNMICGSSKAERYIHIVGEKGEIEGKLSEDKLTLSTYRLNDNYCDFDEEIIDVSKKVVNNAKYGGHSGGDFEIMRTLCAFLNGDESSLSLTKIEDSVNGHLCIFGAEVSRKQKRVVEIDEEFKRK